MAGIAFPFSIGKKNFPETNDGEQTIVDNVISLLRMGEYEVPMAGAMGANTHGFVFKTITPLVTVKMANSIRQVVAVYEPRMVILAVDIHSGTKARDKNVVYADIEYRIDQIGGSFSTQVGTMQSGVI